MLLLNGSDGDSWALPVVSEPRRKSSRLGVELRTVQFIRETSGKNEANSYREP